MKEPLKKLPFTIPELVAASPCKSTDGILYTGKKVDTWFSVDRYTGNFPSKFWIHIKISWRFAICWVLFFFGRFFRKKTNSNGMKSIYPLISKISFFFFFNVYFLVLLFSISPFFEKNKVHNIVCFKVSILPKNMRKKLYWELSG